MTQITAERCAPSWTGELGVIATEVVTHTNPQDRSTKLGKGPLEDVLMRTAVMTFDDEGSEKLRKDPNGYRVGAYGIMHGEGKKGVLDRGLDTLARPLGAAVAPIAGAVARNPNLDETDAWDAEKIQEAGLNSLSSRMTAPAPWLPESRQDNLQNIQGQRLRPHAGANRPSERAGHQPRLCLAGGRLRQPQPQGEGAHPENPPDSKNTKLYPAGDTDPNFLAENGLRSNLARHICRSPFRQEVGIGIARRVEFRVFGIGRVFQDEPFSLGLRLAKASSSEA